mgnify:CR=1 FL=1
MEANFKILYYIGWIIQNPVSKIFSPFAKFYMIILTKIAPKPYVKTLIPKISNLQTIPYPAEKSQIPY